MTSPPRFHVLPDLVGPQPHPRSPADAAPGPRGDDHGVTRALGSHQPTGGGGRVEDQVGDERRPAGLVRGPEAGAVVTFQGMTREVARLDYEAYREMAAERIAAILRECIARHGLAAVAAEHRVGSVPLGEPSVIVAVSAPHREEAFAGAREAIDRIKAEAPIWKREAEAGGEGRWAEGQAPPLGSADSEGGATG